MSYGSGIALDEDWDLIVDETGDIKAFYGIDELEKDLSYIVTNRLTEEIGSPLIATNFANIENAVLNLVTRDDRIEKVTAIDVTDSDLANTIEIRLVVVAIGEEDVETEFIFEVEQ